MKLYHELAEYYFAIEEKQRNIPDDINFLRTLLQSKTSPRLLDIGCGTGEHLHRLSENGIRCVGIDSSSDMISIAARRHPEGIEFHTMDMKKMDFYDEFDAVISLFGSINYLQDNYDIETLLWNIWRAMKTDGSGVLEVWNSEPIKRIGKKTISPVSTTLIDGTSITRERGFRILDDTVMTIVEVQYRYVISEQSRTEIIKDRHVMRAFSVEEMKSFLLDSGFNVREVYSNFRKEAFNKNSNKIIVLFDKR